MESEQRPTEIGSAIFRVREARSLSVTECADRSKLTVEQWVDIEAGNDEIRVETFWQVADGLKLLPSQLMRMIESPCG